MVFGRFTLFYRIEFVLRSRILRLHLQTQRLSFSSASTGKLSSRTSLNIGEDAEDDAFEEELSGTYDRLASL